MWNSRHQGILKFFTTLPTLLLLLQNGITPGRIADSLAPLLARIGSPAPDPKPRGKSPGWPTGQPRTKRMRYPTVKKRFSQKKGATTATA